MAITKIEFYNNGVLIGERNSEPFTSYDWLNAPVGNHVLSAKVYVDGALVATSSNVSISVVESNGFDADYNAVLNYATANSIPLPDAAQQEADNSFILSLKENGRWNLSDGIMKFSGTADPLFKRIDLKRKIQIGVGGGLTWDADGVSGDGSTGYIDTLFTPANGTNYLQNDASLTVKTLLGNKVGALFGNAQEHHIQASFAFSKLNVKLNNNTAFDIADSAYSAGLVSVSRNNATDIEAIFGGQFFTEPQPSTGLNDVSTIKLLASANSSGEINSFSTEKISHAFIGASITQAQHDALNLIL